MKNRRRILEYSGPIIVVVSIVLTVLFFLRQPAARVEPECYEELVPTMTIQEVANLFDTPLVELTWLPDNVETEVSVTTFAGYSRCSFTVHYHEPDTLPHVAGTVKLFIESVNAIELTKTPENCQWNFNHQGPQGSDCYVSIDGLESTIRLQIDLSPSFDPETILSVIDGIRVVEPRE